MAGEPEGRELWRSGRGSGRTMLVAILVSICLFQKLSGQEQSLGDATPGAAESAGAVEAQDAEKKSELRRQSALAGLLVLALLCVVFLTLMICVVVWARRMRRLTGQPLPDQHPGDPLWYLRKPLCKPVAKADEGGSDD
jgi:hypothetical protein